jgi:hypothetical protein
VEEQRLVFPWWPDATFEVLAGPSSTETPLDSTVTWTGLNATAGGVALVQTPMVVLTNAGAGGPNVARLVEAVSNSKIVITLDLRTGSLQHNESDSR